MGVQEIRTLGTENLNFILRILICISDSGGILEASGVRVSLCGSYLT